MPPIIGFGCSVLQNGVKYSSGEVYESSTADESALNVNTDADVTLTDITVSKTGDSDGGDNCNFYGLNAVLLVMGGSTTTITGATIESSASGANGVFSYGGNGGHNGAAGDGTTVVISDSTITTTGDGSGGSLTSLSGHMFHVTNTHAVITLEGVTLVNEGGDVLLSVCDDGWSGASNIAELNAVNQALTGTILVGDNSTLTLTLTDGSTFEGTISGEIENTKGETVSTEVGTVSVTLDETSTWTLTADTYITEFNGDVANVITNGYTLYVNGGAAV